MFSGSLSLVSTSLIQWYSTNKRNLPWRKTRDPYSIMISEFMLQQTTVQAVLPYFEKFMARFPNIQTLANTSLMEVSSYWAGLGYYSRVRNLHRASQILAKNGFPKTYEGLLDLPGFGPYTSRAVASLAFEVPVGVLDANVIRILCRLTGQALEWWRPQEREKLQELADQIARQYSSSETNQAMMELGALVCTNRNPSCPLCPWQTQCLARKHHLVEKLPLKKSRPENEHWLWQPQILIQKNRIALLPNCTLPVLKKTYLPPGKAKKITAKPKDFDFVHPITHHKIYVKRQFLENSKELQRLNKCNDLIWVRLDKLKETNPSSLLRKAVNEGKAKL